MNKAVKNSVEAEAQEKPVSVRESIQKAIETHSETDDIVSDRKLKEDKELDDKLLLGGKVIDDKENEEIEDKEDKDKKEIKDKKEDKKEDKTEQLELPLEVKKEEAAPSIIPNAVKQHWDKLPAEVKAHITKVQKDYADSKGELTRKTQQYRELDQAIAPYQKAIQNWGSTPAQTVGVLFQWMDALTGNSKVDAIHQLAANFGIDLPELYHQHYSQQTTKNNSQNNQENIDNKQINQSAEQQTDPRVLQVIESMYGELNTLKGTYEEQKQARAKDFVDSWAGLQPDGTYKNKPHFAQVRPVMYSLLASGHLPLVNGQLDLDTAYENACYVNPEIRQLLLEETEAKKQTKIEENSAKKVAERRASVEKARSLDKSLKPASLSSRSNTVDNKGRVHGANGKFLSVRDSITAAISEVNS